MTNNNYFFDTKHLEVNQEGRGFQVHPLVALALATAVGGLFVVFLPFIGLYLFTKHMASLASAPIKGLFTTAAAPIAAPGLSYMDGSGQQGSPAAVGTLEKLEKEVQAARDNSKS